jgi:23S rRNA A1618 N6-methylase RlmF
MLKDKNKMNEMIDLRLARKESKHILLDIIKLEEAIDVVICNPPFFESAENTISVMK